MAKPKNLLFQLPIASTKGTITVTQPAKQIYLLTWSSGDDNRLTTDFCHAVLLALDILQLRHAPGVLITTSSIPKFYSNGLDLDHARANPDYFRDALYPLWRRFLTYPMPTIALVNGHAYAGGFMLAMMQDYRVMNPHRGYLCLIGLELGYPLRPAMMSVFKEKVMPQVLRRMVLEAVRFTALDALKEGLIDSVGGLNEVVHFAEEYELVKKAQPGRSGEFSYGLLKREMYWETVGLLDVELESGREEARTKQAETERKESEERVRRWEKDRRGSKL